jgi:ketosteroid isomerase-like protein
MHTGSCHCGAVRLTLPSTPATATHCNCSLCRRIGGPWVYFEWGAVAIEAPPNGLLAYEQGDRTLRTMRCAHCGTVTHWEPVNPQPGARHGVHLGNFDPALIASIPARQFDGAVTWRFFDDLNRDLALLKAFYAAINRNDLSAANGFLDPDVLRTEPGGFPTSGSYNGAAAVQSLLAQGRSTWAEGSCEPEDFHAYGPKVVAYLHVHVRLHGATDWIDTRFADGFVIRNDRIAEWHSFSQRAEALAWAEIVAKAEDTPALP